MTDLQNRNNHPADDPDSKGDYDPISSFEAKARERRAAVASQLLSDLTVVGSHHRLHPNDLEEGEFAAEIVGFGVEETAVEDLRLHVTWTYKFSDGPHAGCRYDRYKTVTERSQHYFAADLHVVTGKKRFKVSEIYDAERDEAGSIRDLLVGAKVRVRVARRFVGRRQFVDVDPIKLIEPPQGS